MPKRTVKRRHNKSKNSFHSRSSDSSGSPEDQYVNCLPPPKDFTKVSDLPDLEKTSDHKLIYVLALRNDIKNFSTVAYSIIPNKASIWISRESPTGSRTIDDITNDDGKLNHMMELPPFIYDQYPVPPNATILHFVNKDRKNNTLKVMETLLIDGNPDVIKVSVTGVNGFANSFVFKQPIEVVRDMSPPYPHFQFKGEQVIEHYGILRHRIQMVPSGIQTTPMLLICQVVRTKRMNVLSYFPINCNETIFLECLNDKLEPRNLDSMKIEKGKMVHQNSKLNTSFNQNTLYPGMILIKIIRPNSEDVVQVMDTLYPGPEVHDVKIRLALPKPEGGYNLLTTIPVPNTRINEYKKNRIDTRHNYYAREYGKKRRDSKPIIEYYYYSDEDESDDEPPPVLPKLTIYVDDDGNIIDTDGRPTKDGKLTDILSKMNEKGIKVNYAKE
ncbi:hypothetical protein TVAG_076380 [Trichomonas vaginalis G3]|uniref:Uncharacterized protein n=1 Tax=Trichomonas vaginalis (strain ATCC PRA-98 / G3) TaxID=412133 RepID=A2D9N5_TRIV3|nr:hypothetical protein TVAGG3_0292640 [Trichomonas vaginalis G3]EAY22891.1 hypothetical protein TVAG_076380 [Trichomonas vaginalis G3]KAI5527393.1 hypothetical protein TVAGG3_0292640 [Trichomonas vaginalis G3]|eukprot:XP_001583877.1 hypothetical protein [Trichomonas vaginalis G3]